MYIDGEVAEVTLRMNRSKVPCIKEAFCRNSLPKLQERRYVLCVRQEVMSNMQDEDKDQGFSPSFT